MCCNPTVCCIIQVLKFNFCCNSVISQPPPHFQTQFSQRKKVGSYDNIALSHRCKPMPNAERLRFSPQRARPVVLLLYVYLFTRMRTRPDMALLAKHHRTSEQWSQKRMDTLIH